MRRYIEALWPFVFGAGSMAVVLYLPTIAAIAFGVVLIVGILAAVMR